MDDASTNITNDDGNGGDISSGSVLIKDVDVQTMAEAITSEIMGEGWKQWWWGGSRWCE